MPTVHVLGPDPVRGSELVRRADVELTRNPDAATVLVSLGATVDDALLRVRRDRRCAGGRLVIVADTVTPAAVYRAVRAGASAILRHEDADPDRLGMAIRTAATGDEGMPREPVGQLPDDDPAPAADEPLTEHEVHVLRLVADGYGNADIARRLQCSHHTVKNTIHDLMTRLRLRNRTHAAAFAVRTGLA
jgi:DNA-binding NarL/FixJ family response regulator